MRGGGKGSGENDDCGGATDRGVEPDGTRGGVESLVRVHVRETFSSGREGTKRVDGRGEEQRDVFSGTAREREKESERKKQESAGRKAKDEKRCRCQDNNKRGGDEKDAETDDDDDTDDEHRHRFRGKNNGDGVWY